MTSQSSAVFTVRCQAGVPCTSIDVGFIVYNERDILGPTLDALLVAGFDSFVVLDMNSTDGTTAYLRDRLGDKVRINSLPRRSLLEYGYAEARNTCAVFSSREWLLFVDADEVLIGGVEDGVVVLKSHGGHPDIYSIERKNLCRDPEAGPGAIKVESVELHNRLYKPTIRMRYAGYIHEEIFVGGRSLYQDSGRTALVFDHYSNLKPVANAQQKAGLYGLMLLRAYNQPDVRGGTNAWWFETYVPQHMAATVERAKSCAEALGINSSFYGEIGETPVYNEAPKQEGLVQHDEIILHMSDYTMSNSQTYKPEGNNIQYEVDGIKYSCPPGAFLNSYLAGGIDYEAHVTSTLLNSLSEGMHFVDIGANVGAYTLKAARRVGINGKVTAVEADQANAQCLLHSARLNNFDNMEVWPVAASSRLKTEALITDISSNSGTRDLSSVQETTYALVMGMPIDILLSDQVRVDVIKIDIEAREYPAMLGCQDILKRFKPLVFSEFTPHAMAAVGGSDPSLYLKLFLDLGYQISVLHIDGTQRDCGNDIEKVYAFLNESGYAECKYLDLLFRNKSV